MVSAVNVIPYPGDNPLAGPLRWSVRMNTSGMYWSSTPLADSIIRLVMVGEVLKAYDTPRIFLILPGSVYYKKKFSHWVKLNDLIYVKISNTHTWSGRNCFLMGQVNKTSPPPFGGAPLLLIFKTKPSSTSKNLLRTGIDEQRNKSTEGSIWLLVIPLRVNFNGVLKKGPIAIIGSR